MKQEKTHKEIVRDYHRQREIKQGIVLALAIFVLFVVLFSCKKETPIPEANKIQADQFRAALQTHNYRLVSYQSEVPIDYEPSDTVPAMTNHWQYVSYHLKDDELNFSPDGTLVINQNGNWMTGTDTDTLMRVWNVNADREGVAFHFLNFTYQPLSYRLVQLGNATFAVRAKYNGNDVISTFKVLP
jgi:hypothetical protein